MEVSLTARPTLGDRTGTVPRMGHRTSMADAIERQPVAGRQPLRGHVRRCQPGPERRVAWSGAEHPVLGDGRDPVPLDEDRETCDVVLVRMGEDDEVQAPVPGRHVPVEHGQQPIGVGAAVEQDPTATRPVDEDRVTLADVEHRDRQATWSGSRHGHGRRGWRAPPRP